MISNDKEFALHISKVKLSLQKKNAVCIVFFSRYHISITLSL